MPVVPSAPASGQPAHPATQPAHPATQPAHPATQPAQTEPSWGQVLVTTIKLWLLRRLRLPARHLPARHLPAWHRPSWPSAAWRWRLAAMVAALALGAGATLAVTGAMSPAARVLPASDNASGTSAGRTGTAAGNTPAGNTPAGSTSAGRAPAGRAPAGRAPAGHAPAGTASNNGSAAATIRSQAAAWIASQLDTATIIACDPAICAALQAAGVNAGRLMLVQPGTANPGSAEILVTAPPASQRAARYAPALIASFGSGATRIDVRATEPGGAAAYAAALRADLAARRSAGSELLRNGRLAFTAQDARQLRAGQVDARVLATLAALAVKYQLRVDSFGDAAPGVTVPGAGLPLRSVTITITAGQHRTAGLASALALVRSQSAPYQPAHAAIVYPAASPAALNIEFAAPSPLGLLMAVLTVHQQAAA